MAASETHHILDLPTFADPVKLAIVVAPYYKDVADMLIAGAQAELAKAGAASDVFEVPGALELPTAIGILQDNAHFDGFVALGCVIRGETTHYDTVCNDSSRGLTLLGLDGVAIGNGILTVENMDQAVVRADPTQQNKGGGAAAAALHLIALRRRYAAPAADSPFGETILIAGDSEGPTTA